MVFQSTYLHVGLSTVPLNNAVEFRLLIHSPQTQHYENDAVNCPEAVKLLVLPALLMEITDRTPVCVGAVNGQQALQNSPPSVNNS